ncbi:MAG: hypothetical protein WC333_00510 [Dehalococcoidia bacterium]|jgi:hypothetical protein
MNSKKYIIVKDRVEIYKDFTLNLLYYIDAYYLDRETLKVNEDIYNHYSWCYNKVCEEFLKENIDFRNNKELKEYYYSYYYHQYYKIKGDSNKDTSLAYYEKFWRNIFEIDKQKNKNIINILIEIYTIYDKSINQEKNILEIV